jgi:prevent-host-death family protein
MVKVVNVHDAKTNLSRLLAEVERGEEIVIARAGTPCARLIPVRQHDRQLGTMAERWPRLDDDFFAPLDDADLAEWDE